MQEPRPLTIALLGLYHFVLAFVLLLAGLLLLPAQLGVLQRAISPREALGTGAGLFFSFLLTWGGALLALPVGWGLLRYKEWARWGAIALAAVGLFAIYPALIIAYLVRADVKGAFAPGR